MEPEEQQEPRIPALINQRRLALIPRFNIGPQIELDQPAVPNGHHELVWDDSNWNTGQYRRHRNRFGRFGLPSLYAFFVERRRLDFAMDFIQTFEYENYRYPGIIQQFYHYIYLYLSNQISTAYFKDKLEEIFANLSEGLIRRFNYLCPTEFILEIPRQRRQIRHPVLFPPIPVIGRIRLPAQPPVRRHVQLIDDGVIVHARPQFIVDDEDDEQIQEVQDEPQPEN